MYGLSWLRKQREEISEREHGLHARAAARSAGVDAADRGVGMRAAHECRLQRVGKAQVRDEAAGPREQGMVFEPFDGMADVFHVLHALPRN